MAERAYTRFEVSIGSRYSWTTFPNLSTTGLKIRCERGNGDAACFQLSRRIPPSLRGGRGGRGGGEGKRGRLHRWESMQIRGSIFIRSKTSVKVRVIYITGGEWCRDFREERKIVRVVTGNFASTAITRYRGCRVVSRWPIVVIGGNASKNLFPCKWKTLVPVRYIISR